MRAPWRSRAEQDHLSDALTLLAGWSREGPQLTRILLVDEAQHAALTERIKIFADALHLVPEVRRLDGHTQIRVGARDGTGITEGEVTLAARIENAYRAVTGAPSSETGLPSDHGQQRHVRPAGATPADPERPARR